MEIAENAIEDHLFEITPAIEYSQHYHFVGVNPVEKTERRI